MKLSSLEKGCVLHLPLSKDSLKSSLIVADKTPYMNDGTSANTPVFVADRMGIADRAMDLNGVDDHFICGNDESFDFGTNDLSISFWIKQIHTADNKYITRRGSTGRYIISVKEGTVRINSYFGSGYDYWTSSSPLAVISDNDWSYVTAIFDRDGYEKMYIDGVLKVQVDISPAIAVSWDNTEDIIFGKHDSLFLNGSLDDVRIYNRALSETEVMQLHESYHPGMRI